MALEKRKNLMLLSSLAGLLLFTNNLNAETTMPIIDLPAPHIKTDRLNQLLQRRRSQREFGPGPVSLLQLSQLLWSAQGITDARGLRTAPSAGALYPLELYVIAGDITDLDTGLYHYLPEDHRLKQITDENLRHSLADAALGQDVIKQAPLVIVITGLYARTERKYGQRAERYTHIEVGHVAQNIYLQVTALELATVIVGAFDDARVRQVLNLDKDSTPLALLPIGRRPKH